MDDVDMPWMCRGQNVDDVDVRWTKCGSCGCEVDKIRLMWM